MGGGQSLEPGLSATLQTCCDREEMHVVGPEEDTQITEPDTGDTPDFSWANRIQFHIDNLPAE
jgi:hypothetical protein